MYFVIIFKYKGKLDILTYYTILEITSGYEQCQETSMIEWCISDIDI